LAHTVTEETKSMVWHGRK